MDYGKHNWSASPRHHIGDLFKSQKLEVESWYWFSYCCRASLLCDIKSNLVGTSWLRGIVLFVCFDPDQGSNFLK